MGCLAMKPIQIDVIEKLYEPDDIREPFSVCMTVKNEVDNIIPMLGSIFSQTRIPDEIVIVDGGSDDGTMEFLSGYSIARASWLKFYYRPGTTPAQARNIAWKAARHELQATVDAGCILDPRFFANLIGPMCEKDPPDIASGVYGPIVQSQWSGYFIPNWRSSALKDTFLPSCRCMAIRRSLIKQAGGFPEHLSQRWGEDTLFALHAREHSQRWVINRNSYVGWEAPKTLDEARLLAHRYGVANGEIGLPLPNCPTSDPVLAAVAEGHKLGSSLRKSA